MCASQAQRSRYLVKHKWKRGSEIREPAWFRESEEFMQSSRARVHQVIRHWVRERRDVNVGSHSAHA